MISVTILAELVNIDDLSYNDLAELDAMDDMHATPDQATPADREWVAAAFAADDDGWNDEEWDRWCWELDEPEGDDDHYHSLATEQWTLTPGAEADFEHCKGLIG